MMKSDEERAAYAMKSNEEQAAEAQLKRVEEKDAQNAQNETAQKKIKLEQVEEMKSNEEQAAEVQLKQIEDFREKMHKIQRPRRKHNKKE